MRSPRFRVTLSPRILPRKGTQAQLQTWFLRCVTSSSCEEALTFLRVGSTTKSPPSEHPKVIAFVQLPELCERAGFERGSVKLVCSQELRPVE